MRSCWQPSRSSHRRWCGSAGWTSPHRPDAPGRHHVVLVDPIQQLEPSGWSTTPTSGISAGYPVAQHLSIIEPLTSVIYAPATSSCRTSGDAAAGNPRSVAALPLSGAIIDHHSDDDLCHRRDMGYNAGNSGTQTVPHLQSRGRVRFHRRQQEQSVPLLMASVLITMVMIPASVLLYRDDTGRRRRRRSLNASGCIGPDRRWPRSGHGIGVDDRDDALQLGISGSLPPARPPPSPARGWPYPWPKPGIPRATTNPQGAQDRSPRARRAADRAT